MPATPARIGFITNAFRLATAGPDAGVVATYGALARDVPPSDPVETFFVAVNDAQAMADERQALLGAGRRRFPVDLSGASEFLLDLDNSQVIPTATAIDPRADVDRPCIIVRARVELGSGKSSVEAWG